MSFWETVLYIENLEPRSVSGLGSEAASGWGPDRENPALGSSWSLWESL